MSQGLIPQDIIERIRERLDIVDVVSSYVSLTRAGQNLKGLCPFHPEKTPSFSVSPSRQFFHCFGCHAGGSVYDFVMRIEGLSFPEAVRKLAHKAGVEIPEATTPGQRQTAEVRERVRRINESAAAYFRRNLAEPGLGRQGRAYLAERGIRSETSEQFRIGFSLPAWDGLLNALTHAGASVDDLLAAGLVVQREPSAGKAGPASGCYDRFRNRIMFPICDLSGHVIGFGGRSMGDIPPKYLNSSETSVFSKSKTLFALDRAREAATRAKSLILVEGYFDVVALHQAGIRHAAATLGTALTPDHVQIIRRFVSQVMLLFDPDNAGVNAALRALDLFANSGLEVRVMSLPKGHDPDTFVRQEGVEAFAAVQSAAPSLLTFAVDHCMQAAEGGTMQAKVRGVDAILRTLQKAANRVEREECFRVVAERLGVSQSLLIERYRELATEGRSGYVKDAVRQPVASPVQALGSVEERDLAYFLVQGRVVPAVMRELQPEWFGSAACRRLVELAKGILEQQGQVDLRTLLNEAMSDPMCAPVVTELSLTEQHFDDPAEHLQGCVQTLKRKRRDAMMRDLVVQLRAAERDGRHDEAERLNALVNELRVSKAGAVVAPQ